MIRGVEVVARAPRDLTVDDLPNLLVFERQWALRYDSNGMMEMEKSGIN